MVSPLEEHICKKEQTSCKILIMSITEIIIIISLIIDAFIRVYTHLYFDVIDSLLTYSNNTLCVFISQISGN